MSKLNDFSNIRKGQCAKVLGIFTNGEDLLKSAGEGSRGGKVIGHTKSGKAIYADPNHEAHKHLTKEEHEAVASQYDLKARAAESVMKKVESNKNEHNAMKKVRDHYISQRDAHKKIGEENESKILNSLLENNKGGSSTAKEEHDKLTKEGYKKESKNTSDAKTDDKFTSKDLPKTGEDIKIHMPKMGDFPAEDITLKYDKENFTFNVYGGGTKAGKKVSEKEILDNLNNGHYELKKSEEESDLQKAYGILGIDIEKGGMGSGHYMHIKHKVGDKVIDKDGKKGKVTHADDKEAAVEHENGDVTGYEHHELKADK